MKRMLRVWIMMIVWLGWLSDAQGQYITKGNAVRASQHCFRVSEDENNQLGAVWLEEKLDLSKPVDLEFTIFMGDKDQNGADGIGFVMHTDARGVEALGDAGGGLGFGAHPSQGGEKISPSVGIEFDTWRNSECNLSPNEDLQADHTTVVYNGDMCAPVFPPVRLKPNPPYEGDNVEDNQCYQYRIRWQPEEQTLSLYIDGLEVFTHQDDIVSKVFGGETKVMYGFTGSTGGSTNEQTVCIVGSNSTPEAKDDEAVTKTDAPITIDVLANDSDEDGDALFATGITQSPAHGTVSIQSDGQVRYTPNAGFMGEDVLVYQVCDVPAAACYAHCDEAIVRIVVNQEGRVCDLVVSATATDMSCEGKADGIVSATVTEGSAPYTYQWSNGATSATLTGLSAGTYTVNVRDALGCQATETVTLDDSEQPCEVLPLKLTSFCYDDTDKRYWRISNPNAFDLEVTYQVVGSGQQASLTAKASDNTFFTTPAVKGANTTKIFWQDAKGQEQSKVKASSNQSCSCQLAYELVASDASCQGNDGSIKLNITSGSGQYEYAWSSGATTQDLSNLAPGTYSVTVTDKGSQEACSISREVTVVASDNGEPCFTFKPLSFTSVCSDDPQASRRWRIINPNAEDIPVGYLIYGTNQSGSTIAQAEQTTFFTTKTQGSNTIIFTFQEGSAGKTKRKNLASGGEQCACGFSVEATPTPVSCQQASDGSIGVSVSGGTAPFSYAWSTGATTKDLSGVGAGTYSVSVSDASGCKVLESITVAGSEQACAQVQALNLTAMCSADATQRRWRISNPNDFSVEVSYEVVGDAAQKGSLSAQASGYTFFTTQDVGGANTTKIYWQDEQGNQKSKVKASSNALCPPALPALEVVSDGLDETGQLIWVVSNRDASSLPFDYIIEESQEQGSSTAEGSGNSTISTTAQAGKNTIVISWTDADGNTQTTTATYEQPPLTPPVARLNLTSMCSDDPVVQRRWRVRNPNAFDLEVRYEVVGSEQKGSLTATASSDVFFLTSTITGSNTVKLYWEDEQNQRQQLVKASSGAACTPPETATVEPLNLTSFCYDDTSKRYWRISNPNAFAVEVTYQVVGDDSQRTTLTAKASDNTFFTTQAVKGANTTKIFWQDEAGQQQSKVKASSNQTCSCQLAYELVPVGPSCSDAAGGKITLNITGGSGQYAYLWNTGATTASLENLGSGTYSVTVTDKGSQAACAIQKEISLEATGLLVELSLDAVPSCATASDGKLGSQVSGGSAPYSYEWSGGGSQASLSEVSAGSYTLSVTDAAGCKGSKSIRVEAAVQACEDELSLSFRTKPVSCDDEDDGEVVLDILGGSGSYRYVWSTGATTKNLNQVSAGTYTVTVTDAGDASLSQTGSVTVSKVTAPSVNIQASASALCGGGSVTLSAQGASEYLWYPGGETTAQIQVSSPGSYYVVGSKDGCRVTSESIAIAYQPSSVQIIASKDAVCQGEAVTLTSSAAGGNVWSTGETSRSITVSEAGTYSLTIQTTGCEAIEASKTIAEKSVADCEEPTRDPMCEPLVFPVVPNEVSCNQYTADLLIANARVKYQAYLKRKRKEFELSYLQHCLDVKEDFRMQYEDKEHHYTLYYYDQAGNLSRTVPPEGVKLLTPNALLQVREDREAQQERVFTEHELATTYSYNSLNQLVSQDMPDHGQLELKNLSSLNQDIPTTLTITSSEFSSAQAGYLIGHDGEESHFYTTVRMVARAGHL